LNDSQYPFSQGEPGSIYAYGPAWAGTTDQWTRLVWVYNPEQRPLSEILVLGVAMAFDEVVVEGTSILIPFHVMNSPSK
jgi:hypothetical protein